MLSKRPSDWLLVVIFMFLYLLVCPSGPPPDAHSRSRWLQRQWGGWQTVERRSGKASATRAQRKRRAPLKKSAAGLFNALLWFFSFETNLWEVCVSCPCQLWLYRSLKVAESLHAHPFSFFCVECKFWFVLGLNKDFKFHLLFPVK